MYNGKDSAEIVRVRFLNVYAKLKDWCDDEPDAICELASTDKKFRDLCMQLMGAARPLRASERRSRALFAAPVEPKFLSAWRDYEERYEHVFAANQWLFLFNEFDESIGRTNKSNTSSSADQKWAHADLNASIAADLIEQAMGFALGQASGTEPAVEIAIGYWEDLMDKVGFDLAGVIRRRDLVPFVWFPPHVAARYGDPEKTLVYQSLQQAQEAFIFGQDFAAVALMRSIMEAVLHDHYHAQGNDLSERIKRSVRANQ